jgi:SAM-dependent methyltransferase
VPLLDFTELEPLLACPRCRAAVRRSSRQYACTSASCAISRAPFPFAGAWPVLVDFERSILDEARVQRSSGASPVARSQAAGLEKRVRGLFRPPNQIARRNVARLIELVRAAARAPLVLIVGGGEIGSGIEGLYQEPSLRLVGFDIYGSPWTQFIADGHQIPLADACADGVIVQAVLEHVLDPSQVVSEVHRVLKDDGLVYADTPFLQPVHEGPFDFTRFTDSGHRYLFRHFEWIDSGAVGGPGAQLAWSMDYLARGLFRSRGAGRLFRAAFSWVRWLDGIIPAPYALDAATGVFFLGRKAESEITPREMVAYYRGQQRQREPDSAHQAG